MKLKGGIDDGIWIKIKSKCQANLTAEFTVEILQNVFKQKFSDRAPCATLQIEKIAKLYGWNSVKFQSKFRQISAKLLKGFCDFLKVLNWILSSTMQTETSRKSTFVFETISSNLMCDGQYVSATESNSAMFVVKTK